MRMRSGSIPFIPGVLFYETGILKFGTGDPGDEEFDSLTDISISEDGKTAEIRIPWQLLNVKDPSTKEILGNLYEKGLSGSEHIEGIQFAAAVSRGVRIVSTLPESQTGTLKDTMSYSWKEWENPQFHESLKKSYFIMKVTYKKQGSKGDNQ